MSNITWTKAKKPSISITGWHGRHVDPGMIDERIELRKTFNFSTWEPGMAQGTWTAMFAQMLVVLRRPDQDEQPDIVISMNGKCPLSYEDWDDLNKAIAEASTLLAPIGD